jgi:NAD(P)-dependent dehydrogenase (short-subunit alcohol dehydrogenase family)
LQKFCRTNNVESLSVNLSGKVVAITGAFGTLGAAVATTAARCGAKVALIDRTPIADRLLSALPCAFALGHVDLANPDEARSALGKVTTEFGGLDALINVAGAFRWETLNDGTLDTWDMLYAANTRTAVAAAMAALPHLIARGGGRIVNVGANAATKAGVGMGPYAASKAAVARLTESLAEELKDQAITVNAVLPSIIDTPQNRSDMPDADFSRWVSPESIAEVILFLVSDSAAAVTGALIPVTGRV